MPSAGIAYSTLYNTTTHLPISGRPLKPAIGSSRDTASISITATMTDTALDLVYLIPVPDKFTIEDLWWSLSAALDTSTGLDADLVIVDDSGTTVLYDASADSNSFRTAQRDKHQLCNYLVVAGTTGWGHIALKTNTAPTTQQDGTLLIRAQWRSVN